MIFILHPSPLFSSHHTTGQGNLQKNCEYADVRNLFTLRKVSQRVKLLMISYMCHALSHVLLLNQADLKDLFPVGVS